MAPIFTGLKFGFGSSTGLSGASQASGGTVSTPGNGYVYHTFTYPNADSFVANTNLVADVLIVAGGGGGGGGYYAGGGGGGGVVYGPSISLNSGTYSVSVGAGGSLSIEKDGTAGQGGPSSFNAVTAIGGGKGGSGPGTNDRGGSGANAGGTSGYVSGYQPDGVVPQPVPGSYIAYGGFEAAVAYGGAGGGAGGAGDGPTDVGGAGVPIPGFEYPLVGLSSITSLARSPSNNHYGGGGGGGKSGINPSVSDGGIGGGGYSGLGFSLDPIGLSTSWGYLPGTWPPGTPAPPLRSDGVYNTGGGGGAWGLWDTTQNGPAANNNGYAGLTSVIGYPSSPPRAQSGGGGRGGSGVVIIRYLE